jgi:hypothetical protein
MDLYSEIARKAREQAGERAPGELWLEVSPGIYMASSRTPRSERQAEVLKTELEHARILVAQGHTVYLLPEQGDRGVKHPDAVVDGLVFEFKNVTGNVRKIAGNFKEARKKAGNVFLNIIPDYNKETVQGKLKGIIINKGYKGGLIIVHFNVSDKIYYWNVDDLR